MLGLLWLIPFFPFLGFAVLALAGSRLSRRVVAFLGVGSVGASALFAVALGLSFIASPPATHAYTQALWTWMHAGAFTAAIALRLDALSVVMTLVVTVVGFLIHLYSAEFMRDEEGYGRFFAYMNLFVGCMLTLVLADNLLLLYLGWEGVGLCSYLLIGFWYKDPANGRAARKAFIVTRVGDAAMAVGLFLLLNRFGTLQISDLMEKATQQWPVGCGAAIAAAALLLAGAVGKSAQLPLQTWLPDAMAGPTPVSALIHAATMVTAGVYLIARTHVLFVLAPPVQTAVAVIGAATLLLAGFSALAQRDIKRVLAYSTVSQIGYMFLALGVGAWSAAIFHFMTHAFFKALLFLAAGVVILAQHHEHDMLKMGGLRREMPLTFWTFLIGACSLSALPLVTAGFYSKDLILWQVYLSGAGESGGGGGIWLFRAGLAGALLTSLYTFRMVFLTFSGPLKTPVVYRPGVGMKIPLLVLAVLSVAGGFVELPRALGHVSFFSDFLRTVLPPNRESVFSGKQAMETLCSVAASAFSLAGLLIAWQIYCRSPKSAERLTRPRFVGALRDWWLAGWGFDSLYDGIFVRPFLWIAHVNRSDFVDAVCTAIAWTARSLHHVLSASQNGKVRRYAAAVAGGAVILIALAVLSWR